ncbi:hypothetical protein RF679_00970 [Undibacterium cyanobacteriorum]|uniref:Uncharacterized protein n=1 Tax=Undibacterium cyanobacteriorum TaxID=3073561 RepID=A0ABY9RI27_9BURK|nr:hypothetical protein [Undibacterium sp. 20NA77.5]WMW80868.1 hypothetical protein RF679_00970 [Undibacterium sp. 20NA77.5]
MSLALRSITRSSTAPATRRTMALAPRVQLPDGREVVPQHYQTYHHTLASVSAIAAHISLDQHSLLFCHEDQHGIYLQIGLIGRENYEDGNLIRPQKLVYGRKWRIDSDTPDSEIVATAMLAWKKAREHEVRELLQIRVSTRSGKTAHSAALSNHLDIDILRSQESFLSTAEITDETRVEKQTVEASIAATLSQLRFAQRAMQLQTFTRLNADDYLIKLALGPMPLARSLEGDFAEFDAIKITLVLNRDRLAELVYEVMDAFIRHSDRYVEEAFRYHDFARFSRQHGVVQLAQLSLRSRLYQRDMKNARFAQIFRNANFLVDARRAARLGEGALAHQNRAKLRSYSKLTGHLPADY